MKRRLRELLEQRDTNQIAKWAGEKRRVLNVLVSLTFDSDALIRWRAVEAMGVAAERLAPTDPDCVRNSLRRLHWLISEESGGICWHAPEAMAEIVGRLSGQFRDYVPIIVTLICEMAEEDLEHFRPALLWAIGRLGSSTQEYLATVLPTISDCLNHPDSQVRGMAVWCLARIGQTELLNDRTDLQADDGPVEVYEAGNLDRTTVSALAMRLRSI